ncbi:CsbD family protein [Acetobacter suratthaniensis]|uniref:CsbD family protein n=1 Tax=Acetobacter suratthaniensis TaxID=1502841 RepID=A0ABS3LHZ0_9PROT|nr:CsbD family protein [Acetobacter suratthaniensis]MBO1327233.1 CsbD family protein [Acetobacter suratthaniensis]MCX2565155.1 CsbD family protein [Acetobacter suratthaniensis]
MADDKIKKLENRADGIAKDVQGHLKDAVGGLTGDVGLQAEGKFDQFAGHMQQDFADLYDEGEGVVEKVVTLVHDKPLLSLGVVSVIGIVLGWLLAPRSKRS